MSMPVRIARTAVAFIIAVFVTYLLAAVFYTQLVIGELGTIGVDVPFGARLQATLDDIVGLANPVGGFMQSYAAVIVVALIVGYAAATGVKMVVKPLAPFAYPAAGAAAIGLALYLANGSQGGIPVMAGAREWGGFLLQMAAGLIGGVAFALLRPHGEDGADAVAA